MRLSTKVKGWFSKSDERQEEENEVKQEEHREEQQEEDDGSPVPDMLRLEGQEDVEEDNFDVKEQSEIAFGKSLDEVAQGNQIGASSDKEEVEEAKEDLAESLPVEEDAKSQPVTEPQAPVGLLDAATPEKENNGL